MANIQIPNLPAVAGLSGPELLEAVQAGSSVKISLAQMSVFFQTGPISFPIPVDLGGTGTTTSTGTGSVVLSNNAALFNTVLTNPTLNNASALFNPGVVNAPSISFTNQDETGIWSPSAGAIAVSTVGVERVRVTSAGDVGIGFDAPDARLSVNGVASFGDGTEAAPSITHFGDLDTGIFFPAFNTIAFTKGGVEAMRINSSGDVGIGTLSPDAKLSVNGAASFADGSVVAPSITNIGDLNTGIFFPSTDTIAFAEGGSEAMRITSSGFVGIGTIAPDAKLSVDGGAASFDDGSASTPSITNIGDLNTGIFFPAADTIAFSGGGTERIRMTSTGNVGIGTVFPDALLSVNGIASFGDGAVGTPSITNFGDLNTGIFFPAADTMAFAEGGVEAMRITSAGFVGISTTAPDALLSVNGAASFGDGTEAAPSITHFGDLDTGIFFPLVNTIGFSTNGNEHMRIDAPGRVLIGDTTGRTVPDSVGSSAEIPYFQISGTSQSRAGMGLFNYSSTTTSDPNVIFNKSLSNVVGTQTAVTTGTILGGIGFNGSDGADFASGANILSYVDGSVFSGSVPGCLVFSTNSELGSFPNERMRIAANGAIGIGTNSPTNLGLSITTTTISGPSGGAIRFQKTDATAVTGLVSALTDSFVVGSISSTPVIFEVNDIERMRIATTGNVAIGNTEALAALHVTGNTMTTGVVYKNQPAEASKAAAATLTIAELLNGIIRYTGAAANLTLPTGTNIEGGVPATFPTNMSFDFSVINTGTGTATLVTAAGLTLIGAMGVAINITGVFRVRKTATNTFTVYRVG